MGGVFDVEKHCIESLLQPIFSYIAFEVRDGSLDSKTY